MTGVLRFADYLDELQSLVDSKENPDEWVVLLGSQCGEYSIHTDEQPDDVEEMEADLPPDERPANPNVDGYYQIGTQGWSADAFTDGIDFVREAGFSETRDVLDRRANGVLLVHESALSEEARDLVDQDGDADE